MAKALLHIPRLFLGFVFLVAGINGYFVIFGWEPFIETSPEAMLLFQFNYLLILEKALEIIGGILLLSNRFVPLALAFLSPIVANIFLLHLFLDPSLLPLAILMVISLGVLLYLYRESFLGIFQKKPI